MKFTPSLPIKKVVKKWGSNSYYWLERPKFDGSQSCYGIGTEVFYPISTLTPRQFDYQMIEKVCGSCPFKQQCFDYAVCHEPYGIWAGTTPNERKLFREKHKIGIVPLEYIKEFFIDSNPRFDVFK